MATVRSIRKLAAIKRHSHEDHLRTIQVRKTNSPRIQEDIITKVSEETEGRVTRKLCEEFSWPERGILGALSRLTKFF